MLTGTDQTPAPSRSGSHRLTRMLRVQWLGQTIACICWICSVLTYGVSSSGDWLQLCAASAWLVANIATIATDEAALDGGNTVRSRDSASYGKASIAGQLQGVPAPPVHLLQDTEDSA